MKRLVIPGLVLALAVSSVTQSGCRLFARAATAAVVAGVIIAATAPPPVRYEVVPAARPGYVWVRGHWQYRHGRYVWVRGHWIVQRHGYYYRAGRWVQMSDGRYRWYAGGWYRR